ADRTVELTWTEPPGWDGLRVVLLLGAWADDRPSGRLSLARRLAAGGVATLIPETPFHGSRRGARARAGGSPIRRVLDHALLTRAAVLEAAGLLEHLHAAGVTPTVAGFSMGASHAGAVAALSPRPVAAALFAVGHSTTVPFLDGILHRAIAWPALGGRRRAEPRLRELLGHICHFALPTPAASERILLAGARSDAYIPAAAIGRLAERWPDARVTWRAGGHVSMWLMDRRWIAERILEVARSKSEAA
ncbi:MAG: alpha/beta hydrolase family protein, partial [Acidobacteriota bacterium]